MFQKVNESEVVSPQGFKVKYGRNSLTYSEDNKYLSIPIEHLGQPYEMEIYVSAVDSWQSNGKAVSQLTPEDKDEVAKRVSESLKFLGRRFTIK